MAAVMAAFLSVIGFTSCMENGGVDYDFMDYMTVKKMKWVRRVWLEI